MATQNASGSRPNPKKTWLLPYIGVQQASDARIARALEQAALDAESAAAEIAAKPGIGNRVRYQQMMAARGVIYRIITAMFREVKEIIEDGQIDAVVAAKKANEDWDRSILSELGLPPAYDLDPPAIRQVQAMITRVLKTERTLSENVWSANAIANGQLGRLVNSSLARGDSADDLAKKVRSFVDPNTPGGATYAARRLGRTEINNAYHAQSIEANLDRPWVIAMDWHLSGSHTPRPGDKCELYARMRSFAPDAVPGKPHPQCMCYVVPQVERLEVTMTRARAGEFDEWVAAHSE